jgi:hypothetical protein
VFLQGCVISYETKATVVWGVGRLWEENYLCDTALRATNFGFSEKIKKS